MVKLQVYVDDETARRIDDARGIAPMSAWVKHAITRQLAGSPATTASTATAATVRWEAPAAPERAAPAKRPKKNRKLEAVPDLPPEPDDDGPPPAARMPDLRSSGGRRAG